jgi:conjugative transfer ATPase
MLKNKIKKEEVEKIYAQNPTLSKRLPWCDYSDEHKIFLLEDKKTLAVGFHLTMIACEARPVEMMQAISTSLSEALKNSIPCEKNNPWILQLFTQRKSDLSDVYNTIESSYEKFKKTEFTKAYLKTIKNHLEFVSNPEGLFFDQTVTQQMFKGGKLEVLAFLYQKIQDDKNSADRKNLLDEILKVSNKFSDQLIACRLKVNILTGSDFYDWMVKWFNPNLKQNHSEFNNAKKPFGWDLTENIFFKSPKSFEDGWVFDDVLHKVVTVQHLTVTPEIGHVSAERKRAVSDKVFNLIDHLPEGSILSQTVVFQSPSEVEFHLKTIYDSAVGHHALAMKVKSEVDIAFEEMTNGNYLFPFVMAVYIQGKNLGELKTRESSIEVLFNSNGFKVIGDGELFPIDAYLRYLPMCYDFHFDEKNMYRSNYMLLTDIVNLLPFYGRSKGTENPGFIAFNRGGEPWFYEFYKDRSKNAHALFLGETGTGKSNLLVFLMCYLLAMYRPKLFIIEAGGSFELFGEYCKSLGLTVNKIKINPAKPISLNPFAHGLKVIDQIEQLDKESQKRFLEKTVKINDDDETESRDILGEMLISALLMITGGEEKEEARIRRADRMLIMDAIIDAAYFVRNNNGKQMIASDIIEAFDRIIKKLNSKQDADKIKRAREMADSLRYFTNDPLSSKFFNTIGNPWTDADITIIDMGKFAQEGYEAQRSVAFAGCVSEVLELAEKNQASDRPIYFVADENHLFTKIPLLASMETRIAKMGRKLGLWLWLATQNLKDFAEESRKMLSLLETWVCLALPPDELDQIEKFKTLTTEQRALFLSARKSKGQYTEGVLLSPKMQGLFRNVPPRLFLAMAATEQEEKNQRKVLMEKLNLSKLEVVEYLSEKMMK